MCVITEKKTATKHRQAMLSQLFVVSGILIGGARAPWAPPGYAYACGFELARNLVVRNRNSRDIGKLETLKQVQIPPDTK